MAKFAIHHTEMGYTMKYALLLLPAFMFMGCASNYGRIKSSVGPDTALVRLGEEKIQRGDKVTVFDRECQEFEKRVGVKIKCVNKTVGQAEVLEVREATNEAVIRADNQTPLTRGLMIEKIIR